MSYPFDPYESLALCSGQCQASRYPPNTCRCPCGGRNHGILRGSRVIDATVAEPIYHDRSFYPQYLPEQRMQLLARDLDRLPDLSQNRGPFFENRTVKPAGPQLTVKKGRYRIARKIGNSFKHALAGYSQDELNERIVKGLRQQFNEENTDKIIDQAYTVFYERVGFESNRPELYELYENGDIDTSAGLFWKRWVIGRPRK